MQRKEKNFSVNHTAHDLNNILTRILNSVELLKKKVSNPTEVNPLISSIENGTYMASEILEDLLVESSDFVIRKKRINLNNLINDLVNLVSIQLKDRISFVLKFEQQLALVEGRYSDLYRVLMNLIINACEAIPNKGIITLTTSNFISGPEEPNFFERGNFVQIKIADNGVGIDSSILQNIFDERFTTKVKTKNLGVGLSIVKRIVEDYSGSIKVRSDKSKGTEFTLKFPALIESVFQEFDKPKSIFIVEDEEIQRELLAELLASHNFMVQSFANGTEITEELKKKKIPDLIIIDQKLPDTDGISCIKKIREMKIKIPIILATGSLGEKTQESANSKIIDRIICKPYNFESLLSVIKELVN